MRIYQVIDSNEQEEIYHFRYQIYAEFMKKEYKYYNHEEKKIYEQLDDTARIYVMRNNEHRIIGTVRVNYSSESDLIAELEKLNISKTEFHYLTPLNLVSKLIIHPQYWNSFQPIILMKYLFSEALKNKIKTSIIYCFDKTLPLFEKIGFVKMHEMSCHEFYDKINVLALNYLDSGYLQKINSPFYKLYDLT